MKNEPTFASDETAVDTKREPQPKTAPLFARFVQAPKVHTGIRAGVRNLV